MHAIYHYRETSERSYATLCGLQLDYKIGPSKRFMTSMEGLRY